MKQALTLNIKETRNIAKVKFDNCFNTVNEEERIDHLGNIYPSKTRMCKHYGISRSLYDYRRKHLGWTVKDALCTPIERKYLSAEKRTINGIAYKNVLEIRKELLNNEISERVLCELLLKYESSEEAVKKAKSIIRKMRKIIKNQLKKNNIDEQSYNVRIWRGWSTVKALTVLKRDEILEEERTFKGIRYATIEEMCKAHNNTATVYLQRRSRGASKEVALLTPIKYSKSIMEAEINEFLSYLKETKIIDYYSREYKFEECRDRDRLPFDFVVINEGKKGIIEFDGKPHFVPTCFWSLEGAIERGYKDTKEAAEKEFEKTRKHDFMKTEFSKRNKIPYAT